ncbi:hypothetical protein KEG38_47450 [Polyangium jinanense]|uniref:hypothetical protein n=1 Tax=Polyangium jinanense TaxID=2829994 RepID=UPI002340671D|nr:hypothetical protein [Polyangium jinanense]MDC3961546.1 hypothetical protein [Polyangium jinanense]
MLNAHDVFELLFAPGQATAWWANLDGEDNKKKKTGRLLVHTLSDWLKKQPHGSGQYRERMQYFFSSHAQSRVDRRFDGVGVEEKVIELKYDKLIDGALGRSLVWVLGGRPKDVPRSDAAAIGLCVIRAGSAPMSAELTNAFIPAVIAAQRENVHVVFVHGEHGERWPKHLGLRERLPGWLSVKEEPSSWYLEPPSLADAEALEQIERPTKMNKTLFGKRPCFTEDTGHTGKKIAIASWSNHWQMMDVALTLRGLGYAAVKMFYSGSSKLVPAGRGVEKNIRTAMKSKFSIDLDWGVALD